MLYELKDEYDICADSDICYDGNYPGTPLPVWSPSLGRTGCLNLGTVRNTPKALPAFFERLATRTD